MQPHRQIIAMAGRGGYDWPACMLIAEKIYNASIDIYTYFWMTRAEGVLIEAEARSREDKNKEAREMKKNRMRG